MSLTYFPWAQFLSGIRNALSWSQGQAWFVRHLLSDPSLQKRFTLYQKELLDQTATFPRVQINYRPQCGSNSIVKSIFNGSEGKPTTNTHIHMHTHAHKNTHTHIHRHTHTHIHTRCLLAWLKNTLLQSQFPILYISYLACKQFLLSNDYKLQFQMLPVVTATVNHGPYYWFCTVFKLDAFPTNNLHPTFIQAWNCQDNALVCAP